MENSVIGVTIKAFYDCVRVVFNSASPASCKSKEILASTSIDDKEEIMIENIVKYEYIPLDDLNGSMKNLNKVLYVYEEGNKEGVKVCIGYDTEGCKVWFDMLNSHCLVGGASRWGKSSFLNVFITSTMLSYTENEVAFMGCDFKFSDVFYYRRYKHFRGDVATTHEEFIQHMNKLDQEMKKRSVILENSNCRNVVKYNQKSEVKMSYIIYVIDELPLLTSDKKCTEILRLMMGKSASYGIYFMLATQDCTKETIGKCKMNCSQTVGFHTRDETDSKTLIGYEGLNKISVKGRCHFDSGAETIETQVFFIEEEEIERLLRDKLKDKYK